MANHNRRWVRPVCQPHAPPANPKVLILDDSSDILELLSMHLGSCGFDVSTGRVSAIRTGEIDGPRLIGAISPDVIVFDVAWPYEANWQLAADLHDSAAVRIPFVLTTTNARAARRLIGRDLIELVEKPYDLDTLCDVIFRSFGPRSNSADEAAPENAKAI
jgi:DNA-binding response OmpR family regulator